jgi:hypothetical protein
MTTFCGVSDMLHNSGLHACKNDSRYAKQAKLTALTADFMMIMSVMAIAAIVTAPACTRPSSKEKEMKNASGYNPLQHIKAKIDQSLSCAKNHRYIEASAHHKIKAHKES